MSGLPLKGDVFVKRFRMPIIIFSMIVVLFLSFFVFPIIGYSIEMGYGFEWQRRYVNSLIMSGAFILLWTIVLFVANKTKSRLLFELYKYYWLAVVGTCIFIVLGDLFNVDVFITFVFIIFFFFVIPIYGVSSLFVLAGFASSRDNLMIFSLFVAVIILLVGIFVKNKFLNENKST